MLIDWSSIISKDYFLIVLESKVQAKILIKDDESNDGYWTHINKDYDIKDFETSNLQKLSHY